MSSERELFQAALGLAPPWQVREVRFDPEAQELHLFLDFPPGSRFPCPDCGSLAPVYDTDPERRWRHLNFFEHRTLLHARFPRTHCPQCGVHTVEAPWARPGSGFTLLFEAFILTLAKQMPIATLAACVGEHDTRLWRVLAHYVREARAAADWSGVRRVGLDETASQRGQEYVSLFVDLDARQVLTVTEGKDARTVATFAEDLAAHQGQVAAVEAVCLDLSPAFRSGVATTFPAAVPVFDRFHIVQLVNAALDQVRRAEVKEEPRLKGTRYLWLKNPAHLTAREQGQLAALQASPLQTVQAYQWKVQLQALWQQPDRDTAATHLEAWCRTVLVSELPLLAPLRKVARTLQAHAEGILNFFTQGLTNGLLEGLNSLVQAAKSKARGFRNWHYFATIIYLLGGTVDPLPT